MYKNNLAIANTSVTGTGTVIPESISEKNVKTAPSLLQSIKEKHALANAAKIDEMISRNYGNSDVYHLETTTESYRLLWEKLSYCTLDFLGNIEKQLPHPEGLEDILVWNGSQPITLGNDFHPLSIEFRILRILPSENQERVAKKTLMYDKIIDKEGNYLPSATIDRAIFSDIKDKTLRSNIISVINAMYMGDEPELCRYKLDKIRYLQDEMGSHCIMIENPPTLSYHFLCILKLRFGLVLSDIRFEKLPDKMRGMMVGTCVILSFFGELTGAVRLNKRRGHTAGIPY